MSVQVSKSATLKEFARLRLARQQMSKRRILDLLKRKPVNALGHRWWPVTNAFAIRFDVKVIQNDLMRIVAQRNREANDPAWAKIDTHEDLSWVDIDLTREPTVEYFDELIDLAEDRMITGEEPPPLEVETSSEGGSGSESDGKGKGKGKGKKKKGKKGKPGGAEGEGSDDGKSKGK